MDMATSAGEAIAAPKLGAATKVVYGTGQTVEAIAATMLPTFLFFSLTAVCGLSGFLAGMTMLITLLIDAVADPLIGALSDNTRSRFGRRHLFMFASVVPLAASIGLLFSVPEGLSQMQVFVLVTIVSIVLRLSYSAYALPHAALGAELSTDYRERSSVAAYRLMFNSLGAFIPVVLGYSVFLTGPKGLLVRAAYVPFAWTCAAILLAIGLFCAAATFPLRHRLFVAPQTPQLGRALLRDIAAIARNRTAQVLFGTVLAFNIAQGVVLNLNIHANKYFWELSDHGLKLVGISHPFGLVAGIFIGAWVAQRFEKKAIVMTGLTIMCLFEAALPLARLAGFIPRDESVVLAVMIPGHFLQFCAYSAMFVSFNSMIADAADEHELKHGVRREGLFFAGVAFAVKSAAGFGGLWAGLVLDLIGFPEKVASTGVGEMVAFRLGLAAGPVAAALTMVCVALMTLYRLDARRHADILAAIAARKTPMTEIA